MEKSVKDTSTVSLDQVRSYWNASPVAASAVPYPLGTPEYFTYYDRLRERNESVEFSYALHEYKRFGGKKVLDVGCGNGYVLSRFANEGAETYGVDLTPAAVELCRKRFAFMGLEGDFRVGNAEAQLFADGQQKLDGRHPRIQYDGDVGMMRNAGQQGAQHGGFTRAHFPGQLNEASRFVDAVQQMRQRFGVALAQIQVARIRCNRKRLFREAEKARVHAGDDSAAGRGRFFRPR